MLTAQYLDVLFKDFVGREQSLKKIKRYVIRPIMFYRPNVYTHSLHLGWMLDDLSPTITKVFDGKVDTKRMVIMGLVHDDLEIIMGDIPGAHKAVMNNDQKTALLKTEIDAIINVSQTFPEVIGEYSYKEMLTEMQEKKTLESKLVKYTDWIDAQCESLHEIYGGNTTFPKETTDEYGTMPSPIDFYVPRMQKFANVYSKSLFTTQHPLLTPPLKIDPFKISLNSEPHTKESLQEDVGYPLYAYWKQLIKKYANGEQYATLYTKQE